MTRAPFLVDAGDARVLATGTQFDVRRDDARIDVTLVEGSVRIDALGEAPTRLRAGQQWRVRTHQAPQVRTVSTAAVTAWKSGRIILDGVTLRQAIVEVNRYASRPVRLDGPGYADARLSGSIDAGDVQAFVTAVTALLPLQAVQGDDGAISLND